MLDFLILFLYISSLLMFYMDVMHNLYAGDI